MSGEVVPDHMDGLSLVPLLQNKTVTSDWRSDFMVEHTGEYTDKIKGCPQYDNQNMFVSKS